MDINDAERTGGLWPQTEAFRPPRPAPTVPELKKLLEQEYRKKLAVSREQSSENPVIRDESLANLADLLQQQGDHVEAESLFRELLESVRQRKPRNNVAVLAKTKNLLGVILSQDSGAPAKTSGRSQEADALVGEVLALLAQSSVADPQDTLLSLNVAALQVWFGKDAEHLATCQRLIEQAEKIPDDPSAEERAAKAWCLKPSSDSAILARTLRAARHAAEQELAKTERGWYQQSLGMAEYRAGNDVAAEQAMTRAMDYIKQSPNWSPKLHPYVEGPARLYRAMTLFRRGEETEARQLFVEAEAQMKPLPKDPREVLLTGAKQDDLLFWLAYKEAKALMQPEAQPAPAR
jgi:tetratricopeptide (TPR) repeat protein